jgi:c(7)-type cytochrome triheme protein
MNRRSLTRSLLVALAFVVLATAAWAQQPGVKKRRPLPHEYGTLVMNNHPETARLGSVTFEHWLHRAKFTCRLCHVDLGFAMKAGGTDVKAADNAKGFYCGACHDGRRAFDGVKLFEACSTAGAPREGCLRCHAQGKNAPPGRDFAAFTRSFPKGRFGNGVDWEKAEQDGLIHPADQLEGVSIPRASITAGQDFALSPKLQGMPDILFSHKKHTVWNGCELCHPEIFVGVSRGATKYSMVEIFEGKYCGVCHGGVAFPTLDCQRCHTKAVQ